MKPRNAHTFLRNLVFSMFCLYLPSTDANNRWLVIAFPGFLCSDARPCHGFYFSLKTLQVWDHLNYSEIAFIKAHWTIHTDRKTWLKFISHPPLPQSPLEPKHTSESTHTHTHRFLNKALALKHNNKWKSLPPNEFWQNYFLCKGTINRTITAQTLKRKVYIQHNAVSHTYRLNPINIDFWCGKELYKIHLCNRCVWTE